MPDLLFELGCEELPASFVASAMEQLKGQVTTRLAEAGLTHASVRTAATPRRLILSVEGLPDRQADSIKESRGPAVTAAFDSAGVPTKAAEGFCRGQGISLEALVSEGDYVWARVHVSGKPTSDILSELLPASVRALTFDKTMRWGTARMRFARPIRWLLAVLDGSVVPFEIEGVVSGDKSRGHRFNHPGEFVATTFEGLLAELRKREVEADPGRRRDRIVSGARTASSGKPEMSEALVDENVFLTEWPVPVEGSFSEAYLELPEPVLVTAMAKHERFFPVRDSNGGILPKFVAVRNAGEDATVRKGCEWVLNARFNDAKFFYDEDKRVTLAEFLERTSRMTFQEKLGSVRQRADRLAHLAQYIAQEAGADAREYGLAGTSGRLAKADLSSGLVGELASLQGVVGGYYARRDGQDESVCHAISTQYDLAKNLPPMTEAARVGVFLTLADQLDKLVGYLGIGLVPTGSSDPYGLRRAATQLIEAAWAWPGPVQIDYLPPIEVAQKQYAGQKVQLDTVGAEKALCELLAGRYEALMGHERYDIVDAALGGRVLAEIARPNLIAARIALLNSIADDTAFLQAASRPLNILEAARKRGERIADAVPTGLTGPAEELRRIAEGVTSDEEDSFRQDGKAAQAADVLRRFISPVNAFFESTMVMDEDPAKRAQNLAVVASVCRIFQMAGDLAKLVQK